MKKYVIAAAALGFAALPGVASAAYLPTGVQNNVALSTVTGGGWTQCYSSTYGQILGSTYDAALSGCSGSRLMLAARESGSSTLLLLAQAAYADVTFNTGTSNVTHNANGVEWYYGANFSWGFAQGGDSVSRSECDTNNTNAAQRLCWHTLSFVGGWRAGAATGLNNSGAYERLIFVSNAGGGVPEPAAWAMMLAGFGLVGGAMRRREKGAVALA